MRLEVCKQFSNSTRTGFMATSEGFTHILDLLFQIGLSLDIFSPLGVTTLGLETLALWSFFRRSRLDRGADINGAKATKEASEEENCAMAAGDSEDAKESDRENPNQDERLCQSPLYYALEGGYVDVGKLLIERGADTRAQLMILLQTLPLSMDSPIFLTF